MLKKRSFSTLFSAIPLYYTTPVFLLFFEYIYIYEKVFAYNLIDFPDYQVIILEVRFNI